MPGAPPTMKETSDRTMSGTSWRVAPLPADWTATQRRILARDHYRCRSCGQRATEVDHIVPAFEGGDDEDANLQSMCVRCHRRKTGREGHSHSPYRSAKRSPERHPGLIE